MQPSCTASSASNLLYGLDDRQCTGYYAEPRVPSTDCEWLDSSGTFPVQAEDPVITIYYTPGAHSPPGAGWQSLAMQGARYPQPRGLASSPARNANSESTSTSTSAADQRYGFVGRGDEHHICAFAQTRAGNVESVKQNPQPKGDRTASRTSSSCTELTPPQPDRKKRRTMETPFQRLDPARQQMFREALVNKYASAEGYIRVRCLQMRDTSSVQEAVCRYDEAFVAHACGLWTSCKGICAATGRQMVWQRADVKERPGQSVSIVPAEGDTLRIGNVALVCSDTALFITHHGFLRRAIGFAQEASKFIDFKRARSNQHFTAICAAWDAEQSKQSGTEGFKQPTKTESDDYAKRVYECRRWPRSDKLDRADGTEMARHAVWLFSAQAGRCALSGLRMSIDQGDPTIQTSVDRIDTAGRHVPGNVRLATRAMNQARGTMPDAKFEEVVMAIARHSGMSP
jgi:hypothetical protein